MRFLEDKEIYDLVPEDERSVYRPWIALLAVGSDSRPLSARLALCDEVEGDWRSIRLDGRLAGDAVRFFRDMDAGEAVLLVKAGSFSSCSSEEHGMLCQRLLSQLHSFEEAEEKKEKDALGWDDWLPIEDKRRITEQTKRMTVERALVYGPEDWHCFHLKKEVR